MGALYAAACAGTGGAGAGGPASTPPSIGSVVPVIQPASGAGKEQDGLRHVVGLAAPAERVERVDRVEHILRLLAAS